jgi:DNA-binding response OmpR family regulator
MNGIEMIEKLKANSATSLIPIVVVSTEASLARTTRLETIGVHATIQKPFHPEQLRVVVNDALEGSHDV